MFKHILIIGGIAVIVLAVLDMLNVPLEIPTSNNTANLAIGVLMVSSPFLYEKFV